jgi:nucleoid-associated protein YgaU
MAPLTRVLIETDTGRRIEASADGRIFFNPESYQLQRQVDYKELPSKAADLPQLQFMKGGSRTLSMSLTFDTYETRQDVRTLTAQVAGLAEVEGEPKERPPVCTVTWGPTVEPYAGLPFTGVLESLTQRFTLFLEDGTPVRAVLDVQFKEGESVQRQRKRNPRRSGSPLEPRRHLVRRGDSLPSLAAAEYGDPARWRPIALANGLVNPRLLEPGTELVIPPL